MGLVHHCSYCAPKRGNYRQVPDGFLLAEVCGLGGWVRQHRFTRAIPARGCKLRVTKCMSAGKEKIPRSIQNQPALGAEPAGWQSRNVQERVAAGANQFRPTPSQEGLRG